MSAFTCPWLSTIYTKYAITAWLVETPANLPCLPSIHLKFLFQHQELTNFQLINHTPFRIRQKYFPPNQQIFPGFIQQIPPPPAPPLLLPKEPEHVDEANFSFSMNLSLRLFPADPIFGLWKFSHYILIINCSSVHVCNVYFNTIIIGTHTWLPN